MDFINDGGYGETVGVYHHHYTPNEFKCPRAFWSLETIFLEALCKKLVRMERAERDFNRTHKDNRTAHEGILRPSRTTDWESPEFGSLSSFRLCVSIRLNNYLYEDAQAAGLSKQDIIDYYNEKINTD